jgi:release factor glutamine methyltransferase
VKTVEFAGLDLLVTPGVVMTPRPSSLALVDCALAHVGDREAVVVDVGTGSGAIAIAVARSAPRATVWATDVDGEAVELARRNAARGGVDVLVCRGDLLEPVDGRIDVVVANLPYLPTSERALHPDLDVEPPAAVYAPGDGLGEYRRLLRASSDRLAAGGLLAVLLRGEVVTAGVSELDALERIFAARAAA